MKKRLFIFIGLLASVLGALPLSAQESCYAQYLREHNMRVLTAEDADDSYDELKKAVLAWQMYGSEASRPLRPIEEPAAPKQQDTTYVIVHLALVDSTWYMWMSVDPLADKYPGNTPYLYCNGNPIMLIDPDGRKVVGHSADDVETFVQDIECILKDPKFDGYRGLINQEGNRLGKISRQDYKTWKSGVELSADEECYVDLLTAIINAPQTCTIEYLENDLCAISIQADTYLSENSQIFRSVQGILPYFGGAITNGVDGISAYSVVAKAGESVINLRTVNSMHEVLGHGYAFIRGFSSGANQVQALRVENLVRRLLGLPAYDGSTHPHPNGANLNKLPRIK